MKDIAIIVNTVSSCSDLWEMFFTQFNKHFPNQKIYVFTDSDEGLPNNCTPLIYSTNDSYRSQYLKCIQQVDEKYCISLNEDYILYSDVKIGDIESCIKFLDEHPIMSFVRLTKGVEYGEPKLDGKFYLMDNKNMWFFSQVAGVWRTRDLEKIHQESPESGMAFKIAGPQLELVANDVCRRLDIKGVFYFDGEPKRGLHHHDSSVFPYIATAIIKGKWNISEYKEELTPLMGKYNIDVNLRGAV
jgi:hypothetical protein